ncbi:hypothetical protein Pyn_06785 [Prunus yedoensis var. nudiflora]|uniref:Uncharacterized protein n=1 Tax=Prunus yedoensis var. nudiflora TaxID=2094558 RepID=A0A314UTU4_PRUYE|nr:hypothetical protein Pyn_04807 [Prunus yedoensis var. nudiflora]PQM36969.1 hypothetical protein Pyn_04809 [Prunus yedoensis var. nudiflora]PQM40176.1 hypothetical protein Pyn_40810 [Prunus yedoensis var. nudiflora]PQP93917.1 hypothetical protein Pyn_11516 [Prunus yedoensis var. nudiflora]PQP95314.1 hypothetical protein Pyn_07880 [Prunus yedoensis var. nudiflora]
MMQSEVQRNCSERHQPCMAAAAFLDEREKEELRSRTGVGLVEQWWNPSCGVCAMEFELQTTVIVWRC